LFFGSPACRGVLRVRSKAIPWRGLFFLLTGLPRGVSRLHRCAWRVASGKDSASLAQFPAQWMGSRIPHCMGFRQAVKELSPKAQLMDPRAPWLHMGRYRTLDAPVAGHAEALPACGALSKPGRHRDVRGAMRIMHQHMTPACEAILKSGCARHRPRRGSRRMWSVIEARTPPRCQEAMRMMRQHMGRY
jgi:hypothetical protein